MFALSFSVHCTLGESFHISRASSQVCEMFYIVLVSRGSGSSILAETDYLFGWFKSELLITCFSTGRWFRQASHCNANLKLVQDEVHQR